MKASRISIHRLMTWVAVFAVNLGAFRLLFASRLLEILLGGMLAWIALQVAVYRAYRGAGRVRCFWVGFVAGGMPTALSFIGVWYSPSSMMGRAWMGYFSLFEESVWLDSGVANLLDRALGNLWGEVALVLVLMVLEFLPVVVAAIFGGFLGRLVFGSISGFRSGGPVPPTRPVDDRDRRPVLGSADQFHPA